MSDDEDLPDSPPQGSTGPLSGKGKSAAAKGSRRSQAGKPVVSGGASEGEGPVSGQGGDAGRIPHEAPSDALQKGSASASIGTGVGNAAAAGGGRVSESSLVSGLEAQAKREAERAKASASVSSGTKIVAKRKKRVGDTSGKSTHGVTEGGDGGYVEGTEKKKKKRKDGKDKASKKGQGVAVSEATAAPAPLGGLLGAYDSSSSDDRAR